MGRGLSELQKQILRSLRQSEIEASLSLSDYGKSLLRVWGVPWSAVKTRRSSRSQASAHSRALYRLEQRKLVERRNQNSGDRYCPERSEGFDGTIVEREPIPEHHRTTNVRLTDAGRNLADELIRNLTVD